MYNPQKLENLCANKIIQLLFSNYKKKNKIISITFIDYIKSYNYPNEILYILLERYKFLQIFYNFTIDNPSLIIFY
jgi:hypothetical protein